MRAKKRTKKEHNKAAMKIAVLYATETCDARKTGAEQLVKKKRKILN